MRRYCTVKENNIGRVLSEILRYRQKNLTTLYNRRKEENEFKNVFDYDY